jgi:hypothetical protein
MTLSLGTAICGDWQNGQAVGASTASTFTGPLTRGLAVRSCQLGAQTARSVRGDSVSRSCWRASMKRTASMGCRPRPRLPTTRVGDARNQATRSRGVIRFERMSAPRHLRICCPGTCTELDTPMAPRMFAASGNRSCQPLYAKRLPSSVLYSTRRQRSEQLKVVGRSSRC